MGIELSRSSSAYCEATSAATDERDHFQLVALADHGVAKLRSPQDTAIHLDGDAGSIETEIVEELSDRRPRMDLPDLAVEPHSDRIGGGYFFSSFLFAAR
jgi:hypothetical protein